MRSVDSRNGDEEPEFAIIAGQMSEHDALVHQASGFIGAALGLHPTDALTVLTREAQRLDVELSVLAVDILERRRPLPTVE